MIFVIDKNTNRVIYVTEEGQPYLLDAYTYRFDGPSVTFEFPMWQYRVEKGPKIVHAPKTKTVVNSRQPVNVATEQGLPPCYNRIESFLT
jgi:hypothetical protein